MIAKFGGSNVGDDSSNDELEELAHLSLMAFADESNSSKELVIECEEVNSSLPIRITQNDFDELQDIFDELHAKHMALLKENKSLKKNNTNQELVTLKSEYALLESSKCRLDEDNTMLSKRIESLSISLEKYTNSTKILDNMLASQRPPYDKSGLGYNDTPISKPRHNYNKNYASSSSRWTNPHANNKTNMKSYNKPNSRKPIPHYRQTTSSYYKMSCDHCSLHCHTSPSCPYRFRIDGLRYKWVAKTRFC